MHGPGCCNHRLERRGTKRSRWHVHLTPTSASWDQSGRALLRRPDRQADQRGAHRSTGELEAAIETYIDALNADPKPFRWTKSATDILASIERFCFATLKTADQQAKIVRSIPLASWR